MTTKTPIVKKQKLTLECRLTEAELKTSSKALAEALNQRSRAEAILETFKAQNKAEQAGLEAIISRNAVLVNAEKEFRQVECEVRFDFEKGIKTFWRPDTLEIVKREAITNDERQEDLKIK